MGKWIHSKKHKGKKLFHFQINIAEWKLIAASVTAGNLNTQIYWSALNEISMSFTWKVLSNHLKHIIKSMNLTVKNERNTYIIWMKRIKWTWYECGFLGVGAIKSLMWYVFLNFLCFIYFVGVFFAKKFHSRAVFFFCIINKT